MNEKVKAKIDLLTSRPGVYLMKDNEGKIIYVGKAKSLIKRVKQYFLRPQEGKVFRMVREVDDFDTIEAIKYIYDFYKTNDLLDKYTIPFAWLKKFFKRQEDKNRYLKDIIDRIDFERPPTVKITNENKHELGYEKLTRKNMYHTPPYKISIKLN